ncbi:hypothetical protein LCGC14_2276910 [marine sediment metagenome]|uniref:Uncharacterized protein n=1 Tax=marine sediment metagenome TaxID=412755 RepID=A0A0F9DHK7_9ZZZZ
MAPFIGPVQLPTTAAAPAPTKSNAQKRCEGKGGVWNEETKTCKLPEEPRPTTTSPEREKELFGGVGVEPKPTKIITDERGRPTGIELPSGRTLLGLGREDIERITGKATGEVIGAQEAAAQEQEQRRLGGIEAERTRISEEERPERRQLDPATSALERVPVLGGTFGVIKDTLQNIVLKTVPEGEFKEAFKEALGAATPEELRTLALTQIEKQEIEKGLTASEQFGAFLEGTGLSRFSIFGLSVSDLVETPSGNVDEVIKKIRKEKKRIANIETNVKLGYLPIADAQAQIIDIENNIQEGESRLILLINNSPELKFNSDKINTIETEILLTREKVFQAKQNILTGQTENPAEIAILQQLLLTQEPEE